MTNFVGIDLGTTNSAICSYDGSRVAIWKNPNDSYNDVTPSAIYFGRRGNKYVGKRAYDRAPQEPDNVAILFKRLMGTQTPIRFSDLNISKSPEECSAEILKELFGFLPEEIRIDSRTGTVITVPAAFNQMQKDATREAANMAGIGKVALMQEPVAAVMSVMRTNNADGRFLIYDLGGGTLDIAIAESISGRVNLLAHGGIAMCGGRDFDRILLDSVVQPWLLDQFDLPEDFMVDPKFKSLCRTATWAAEKAKIELSARDNAVITLSETESRVRDLSNHEIYLEVSLQRQTFDKLIAERLGETITCAQDTIAKAGLSADDIERIVFIGGPTNYKPLRDTVAFELGIPGKNDVNPMTAVAEGASIFAESIDWDAKNHSRKRSRGQISSGKLALSLNYIARTPGATAKIVLSQTGQAVLGCEFQIDSVDTGWTSGRYPLKDGTSIDVALTQNGENSFKVFVFDSLGGPIAIEQDKIIITRTAATVDSNPASHSVGIEVIERIGGHSSLDYLVKEGEPLPKKGKKTYKAAETLKANSTGSLKFNLWEGEIEDPISDNRPVGCLEISGSDFDEGVIPAGAELECEYEILDSGCITFEASVPCIGSTFFSGKRIYSWQGLDYTDSAALIAEEGERTLGRIEKISDVVDSPKIDQALRKLEEALQIDPGEIDAEKAQQSMENVYEARRLLAQVKKEHNKVIRQVDLDSVVDFFNEHVRGHSRNSEAIAFDNLVKTAQRSIDRNDRDFEYHLDELKGKNFEILWRQDWFVVERFKWMAGSPHLFADKRRFQELVEIGKQLMRTDDIAKLRDVISQLSLIRIDSSSGNDMFDVANIIKG